MSFASATGNPTKLNLGNGYVANSLIPYQNYLVLIGNKSADGAGSAQYPRVRIWFWDYASANPNFVFDLNDFVGTAVTVDVLGNLSAITQGKDGMTSLFDYNGSTFVPKTSIATSSISYPLHNQIDMYNGLTHFVGNNSVNQWDGTGFHNALGSVILTPNTITISATGFLKNIDTLYLGLSLSTHQAGYASSYGIFSLLNLTADTTYAPNASFSDQLRVLGYHARAVAMRLYFSQFGTGRELQGIAFIRDTTRRPIL